MPDGQTQFERKVRELGLQNEQEISLSIGLQAWVQKYKNLRYVPEWLLKFWDMEVVCAGGRF